MDLLKKELARKRQAIQDDFGGKKLLRRSEIEQKNLEKLRQQEQQRLAKPKSPDPQTSSDPAAAQNSLAALPPALVQSQKPPAPAAQAEEEQLSRQEVIRRLRLLRQPVTLFGEDDAARRARLRSVLESGDVLDALLEDRDMTEGQTNDFLRDIYELRKRQKRGTDTGFNKKKRDGGAGEGDERGNAGRNYSSNLLIAVIHC